MEARLGLPNLDSLFHRLAVVNAKLHELNDEEGNLLRERRELMELIVRERLGKGRQITWKPGDQYAA